MLMIIVVTEWAYLQSTQLIANWRTLTDQQSTWLTNQLTINQKELTTSGHISCWPPIDVVDYQSTQLTDPSTGLTYHQGREDKSKKRSVPAICPILPFVGCKPVVIICRVSIICQPAVTFFPVYNNCYMNCGLLVVWLLKADLFFLPSVDCFRSVVSL